MKLLFCMMLPAAAAGFTVGGGSGAAAGRTMRLNMGADVADSHPSLRRPTDENHQSADVQEQQTKDETPAASVATKTEAMTATADRPERAAVPNFTGTAPLEESLPTTGTDDSFNKYASLNQIDTQSYNRFGSGAATTFTATAPAGMPPEVDPNSRYLKYRRLDEEFNQNAVSRGFAQTQAKASLSATTVNEDETADGSYYKYKTLNDLDNKMAASKGFVQTEARASHSATNVNEDEFAYNSYYKYKTLNQEENMKAKARGFAQTNARPSFSATTVNEDETARSVYFKYKTLNEEDNERARNSSYLYKPKTSQSEPEAADADNDDAAVETEESATNDAATE